MSQQPSPNSQSEFHNDSLNGIAKLAKLKPQVPMGQTPQNVSTPPENAGNSSTTESGSSSTNNS
jgi:hypothetical protein